MSSIGLLRPEFTNWATTLLCRPCSEIWRWRCGCCSSVRDQNQRLPRRGVRESRTQSRPASVLTCGLRQDYMALDAAYRC